MQRRSVEIISVGNELLTGHTLNTNAHWIAEQVTGIGGMVRRVTVVRDEIGDIASSIRESLGRKPSWLIMSGGLGPTYDDKTLQGLAKAIGKKLVLSEEAVGMLRKKYSKEKNAVSQELTPPRLKMATIPAGAEPVENPVGHAPAVTLKYGSCTLFSLPGVPKEMMAIFSKHIQPVLKRGMGRIVRIETTLEASGVVESALAPYLDRVVASNPRVYIKSHPRGFESGVPTLHINLASESGSRKLANTYLLKAVRAMKQSVMDAGGEVRKI